MFPTHLYAVSEAKIISSGEGAPRFFILSYQTEGRRAGGDGPGGVITHSICSSHGEPTHRIYRGRSDEPSLHCAAFCFPLYTLCVMFITSECEGEVGS